MLLECMTFRLWGHYFGDPMRYIPGEELKEARRQEPVGRYRHLLIGDGVLEEEGAASIEQKANEDVDQAFTVALEEAAPDSGDAFVDVYGPEDGW